MFVLCLDICFLYEFGGLVAPFVSHWWWPLRVEAADGLPRRPGELEGGHGEDELVAAGHGSALEEEFLKRRYVESAIGCFLKL